MKFIRKGITTEPQKVKSGADFLQYIHAIIKSW